MRVLLERFPSGRAAAVLAASAAVLALVHGATADGDAGFRRSMLWPDPPPPLRLIDLPEAPPVVHRHPRRIWAASRSRPLRVVLARRARPLRVAAAHRGPGGARLAFPRAPVEPQVVFPRLAILPKPPRPALVTIYQDRTFRNGDAVMMADGIHVYHGLGEWPHQPRDFVRLTLAAALDWHLRQTLDALDKNPPTRWTSIEATPG